MTTFHGKAIKRSTGWFFQVTKVTGCYSKDFNIGDCLIGYDPDYCTIGRPSESSEVTRFKTRRELRNAVRFYNRRMMSFRIKGGLH